MIGPPANGQPRGVSSHAPTLSHDEPPQHSWAAAIKSAAHELGFTHVGITKAERFDSAEAHLEAFVAAGRHGSMHYLTAQGPRADPESLLQNAKSLVVVGLAYAGGQRLVTLTKHKREGDRAHSVDIHGRLLFAPYGPG